MNARKEALVRTLTREAKKVFDTSKDLMTWSEKTRKIGAIMARARRAGVFNEVQEAIGKL